MPRFIITLVHRNMRKGLFNITIQRKSDAPHKKKGKVTASA